VEHQFIYKDFPTAEKKAKATLQKVFVEKHSNFNILITGDRSKNSCTEFYTIDEDCVIRKKVYIFKEQICSNYGDGELTSQPKALS
jgi:hypothetical protein